MKQWTLVLGLIVLVLGAAAGAVGVARATAMTAYHGPASRAAASNAGCQRLMSDPAAMKVMQSLHAEHSSEVQAWRDRYGASTGSAEAKQALTQLWREHSREMRTAFKKAGIKLPTGVCTRQMMSTASGMMGGAMMGGADAGSLHGGHHGSGGGGTSGMMGAGSGMMGGTY